MITGADLPEGGSRKDFRDPKIWREDGKFYLVAGDRCPDGSGAILLYESEDALRWRYAGTLAESSNRYGRMWECPDFFPLDGEHVLITSPQEMRSEGLEFIEGNVSLCLIGTLDEKTGELCRDHVQTVDYGLDFYAPQTTMTTNSSTATRRSASLGSMTRPAAACFGSTSRRLTTVSTFTPRRPR